LVIVQLAIMAKKQIAVVKRTRAMLMPSRPMKYSMLNFQSTDSEQSSRRSGADHWWRDPAVSIRGHGGLLERTLLSVSAIAIYDVVLEFKEYGQTNAQR